MPQSGREVARTKVAAELSLTIASRTSLHKALQDLPFFPPSPKGDVLLPRSCIAATLGDHEKSTAVLRRAFAKGANYTSNLHRDPDLQLARG